MKAVQVYKKTSDDWHGSFTINSTINLVLVGKCKLNSGWYKVFVRGTDDFSYEAEYRSKEDANHVFNMLIELEEVNVEDVELLGLMSGG